MPSFDKNPYEHIQDIPLACSVVIGLQIIIGSIFTLDLFLGVAGLILTIVGLTASGIYKLVFNKAMTKVNTLCIAVGGALYPLAFSFHESFFLIPFIFLIWWLAVFYGKFEQL